MRKYYPFWFFVFVLILFHFFGYIGHYGYDDLYYAKLAKQFFESPLDFNDHYTYRWTTIIYTSFFFKLFGTGDFAIALSALSISIVTLYITCLLLRQQQTKIIFISLSLQVLGSWYLFYTDKLTPDIYVLLFATLAVYFLYKQRFETKKKGHFINAFGLASAMFLGFLSKETIILLLLPMFCYAINDFIQKKNRSFWIYSTATGFILTAIYFYFLKLVTGNVFARFSAIQANAYYNLCSYDVQDLAFTLRRIGYQFIELFIQTGLALPLALLASAISHKKFAFRKPQSRSDFFIVLSVLFLIAGNFMSTSFKAYSPICLDIRHFLWMMPVMAIASGYIINDYLNQQETDFSITRWLILLCLLSYYFGSEFTFTLYLPFTLVFLVHGFYRNSWFKKYFIFALFIVQIQPVYHWINYAQGLKYKQQKKDILNLLATHPNDTLITDAVQKNLIHFYTNFDSILIKKVLVFSDVTDSGYTGKLIYKNWYTQYLSGLKTGDLPLWMRLKSPERIQIFSDLPLGIEAFKMKNPIRFTTLFRDSFAYESASVYWETAQKERNQVSVFEGKFSEQLKGFSATFNMPLDSLHLNENGEFIIKATAFCRMKDHANLNMVIDISTDEKNLIWTASDANSFMKTYGLWWQVSNEVILDQKEFANKHARLKIYFWLDKKLVDAQIDNWVIDVKSYP